MVFQNTVSNSFFSGFFFGNRFAALLRNGSGSILIVFYDIGTVY